MKVHELSVPEDTDTPIDHPTKIAQEGNRWRIVVELTWDVLPEDVRARFQGDAPVDFARRALDRVRPGLNEVVGKDQAFAHYHILQQPTRCSELD